LAGGRVQLGGGLRWDVFRYAITDLVETEYSGSETSARLQPKASLAYSPFAGLPFKAFFNYGRAIASLDARGAVRQPGGPLIATTDFLQWGVQQSLGSRISLFGDFFHIDTSNQLVYIPDDGSLEFTDPARSYGFETRMSAAITRRLSFDGGITKVLNAYYRGAGERVYVDSAPHFTANAALTLSDWRGWSGSLRMRGINHYRLDGSDPSIQAAGHVVYDFAFNRDLTKQIALNVAVDNVLNREYWETQNYFTSRLAGQGPMERIHASPGYGRTVMAGMTFRFGDK
jgi:outer membrane receptor protein involved in Fe transport